MPGSSGEMVPPSIRTLGAPRSGRGRGEAVLTGLAPGTDAVAARLGERRVDHLREALDLEGEDDSHNADGDGPDPADGDDRGERGAGIGEGEYAEGHLEQAQDQEQPPVRQKVA